MGPSKKKIILTTAFVLAGLLPALSYPAHALTPDYEKVAAIEANSELTAGKISQEKVKIGGKEFHITKAIVQSSPDHVWSYLTNYDKAPQVFSNLKTIRVLDQEANRKKVEFQVVSLGGLMKYDYVLHVVENEPHQMEWTRASGAFKNNDGFWSLKPVNGGKHTLVTYAKHIDGGMFIPQMFVDKQLKSTMPNVIENLRLAVANDRKQIARK